MVTGRDVKLSVVHDPGEVGRQPLQVDGDDALNLPVSISLSSGALRLPQPAKDLPRGMLIPRGGGESRDESPKSLMPLASEASHGRLTSDYRTARWSRATISGVGWPSAGRPACFWTRRTAERGLGPTSPSASSV